MALQFWAYRREEERVQTETMEKPRLGGEEGGGGIWIFVDICQVTLLPDSTSTKSLGVLEPIL